MTCFASLFYNQVTFQKSVWYFFDQVAIDAISVLTFEIPPLVAELKLKTYKPAHCVKHSISALPPEGGFLKSAHF